MELSLLIILGIMGVLLVAAVGLASFNTYTIMTKAEGSAFTETKTVGTNEINFTSRKNTNTPMVMTFEVDYKVTTDAEATLNVSCTDNLDYSVYNHNFTVSGSGTLTGSKYVGTDVGFGDNLLFSCNETVKDTVNVLYTTAYIYFI